MKISSLFKLASSKSIHNKKNIYFIILFTVISTLLLGILNFRMNYAKMLDDAFNKTPGFRTIIVDPGAEFWNKYLDPLIEKQEEEYGEFLFERIDPSVYQYERLKDIDHVIDGHWSKYNFTGVSAKIEGIEEESGFNFIYGSNKIIPENIIGRKFQEGKSNELICPINFVLDQNDQEKIYNGYDLLNKKVTVSYEVIKWTDKGREVERIDNREYEIVGLYDATSLMEEGDECYVPVEEIAEINQARKYNRDESDIGYTIVVDNRKNVDYVIKEIEKLGYDAHLSASFDDETINAVNLISVLSFSVVFVATIIISTTYIRKKVINNETEIGLLKAIGFTNKETQIFNIFELICLIMISFITSLVLIHIILFIMYKTIIAPYIFVGLEVHMFISSYFLTMLIIIVIPLIIDLLLVNKRLKNNIIVLLKGDNV